MKKITRNEMVRYAAKLFKVSAADILADRRPAHIHRARIALYIAIWEKGRREGKAPSYTSIGRTMQRDHSTIIHGMDKARYLMERDPEFREAVEKIIAATVTDLPPPPAVEPVYKKETCNPKLHTIELLYQQRERPMDNPEYTEECINTALERAGVKMIRVYWDGEIATSEDPPRFNVYYDEEGTGVTVTDEGRYFEVTRFNGRSYGMLGSARTLVQLINMLEGELTPTSEEAA